MRFVLTTNKDEVKHWTSLSIDVAKVFGILAGPVGLYILIAYLQSVRAPLPISDFSTTQTLLIISAVYSFIISILVIFVYSPIFICPASRKSRRHIRVRALDYSLRGRRWTEHLGSQPFLFQGSALIAIPTYSVLWMSRASIDTFLLWLGIMSLVGGAISVAVFYRWGIVPHRVRRFRIKLGLRVFVGSVVRGGWCIAWLRIMALLFLAFPFVKGHQESSIGRIATWSVFLVCTTPMYLTLTSVKVRFERFPIIFIAAIIVALAWYPSFFSKRTLHFLGLGGGIPIEVLLRTMDPEETRVIARLVHGCLILNAGSRVIIQPMVAPTTDTCSREPSLDDLSYATMYKGVEVFSGSDIIKLSGATSQGVAGQRN